MPQSFADQRHRILQQIVAIERMERGKLSPFKKPGRAQDPHASTYFKHQAWHEGKNHTCYVPTEQAPALQEAIDGFQRFRELTDEYARLTIEHTRQQMPREDAHAKKNAISKPRASKKPKPSSKSPKRA